MGTIVDQNSNASSVDTWALVTGTTVVNTIESALAGITAIQSEYDYLVDITVQGQNAGIGWTYTAGTDTFAAPSEPPTNWVTVVQDDFDNIANDLLQCLSDAGDLSPSDLATAYALSLSDSSAEFSTNQRALMDAIYNYIRNGG